MSSSNTASPEFVDLAISTVNQTKHHYRLILSKINTTVDLATIDRNRILTHP
ncbi:hypothetical protein SAMN04489841_1059 [Natrinema salaciae]|uniref:Uncharacterized protein n=1 Tax=Natrinema salaciae TaxID=1186196 RepID=A0A1H9CHS6_9EURY|nr:hypothetical protein SAMN04489841_1059 [Natrinema salaciae]